MCIEQIYSLRKEVDGTFFYAVKLRGTLILLKTSDVLFVINYTCKDYIALSMDEGEEVRVNSTV